MRFFVSLLCFTLGLWAQDGWYPTLNAFLSTSLNRLDMFLSDSNTTVEPKYFVRTGLDAAFENGESPLYRFNIKAKITLPRTMKKFKLFLEDFRQKTSVDAVNARTPEESINNNAYLLGLQYKTPKALRFKVGMKFNGFDPFAGAEYQKASTLWGVSVGYGADFRYYARRHEDLSLFCNFSYPLASSWRLAFENSYRYQRKSDYNHQAVDGLRLYHNIDANTQGTWRFDTYLTSNVRDNFHLDYYYLGYDFFKTFVKKRYFMQLSPAILWRNARGFHRSFRFMVSVGINFYKK